jgi:hypothetical protein
MHKKIAILMGIVFLLVAVGSAFGETEDEIVARYLKKAEKKHKSKVGFVSASISYGILSNGNDYNKFRSFANSNISPGAPLDGIYRSYQFDANFGMMVSRNAAFKLGFEYWLKMGSSNTGDYTMGIEPLGTQTDFNLVSEVQIYGINGGVDYYFLNPPDMNGQFNSIALRLGLDAGIYFANWNVWEGVSAINLSTQTSEANSDPLKSTAPGASLMVGADVPILGFLLSANAGYQYMNFSSVKAYNSIDEELYVSYSNNIDDRVELDFSGFRSKLEIRKFFKW